MNEKKSVHLIPENHDYLKRLSYINNSSIQFEMNQIISNKRKEDD